MMIEVPKNKFGREESARSLYRKDVV